ncbi:uncharacterized protein L201_005774 [Kwoniella dendrophila CBS 6074]|uniref:HMG box domain-containing protein n=1 Tax=Kwoniella dendrophila CBS 6074 TaxID=1295534 RepID=A0AAX4K1R0_9TREE
MMQIRDQNQQTNRPSTTPSSTVNPNWSSSSSCTTPTSIIRQHKPQLSIDIQPNNQFQSFDSPLYSSTSTSTKTPYSESTPSPSIPALSRDSVISNNSTTFIQTPINLFQSSSTSSYFIPSHSDYSKMSTTTATHPHQPISIDMDSSMSSSSIPTSTPFHHHTSTSSLSYENQAPQHHFNQPYHLAINYLQDTTATPNQHVNSFDQSYLQHTQQTHLGVSGWTPMISPFTINPQLMGSTPSRSLSPESNASFSPSILTAAEDLGNSTLPLPLPLPVTPTSLPLTASMHVPQQQQSSANAKVGNTSSSCSSTDEWYDGPSEWIRSVAEAHKQRREGYLSNPKLWPKGEGEPKELQPLTDHCRFPHLWEVEEARKGLTEESVVSKLMKKSEATITKEFARCQKAGEDFKPPRPMNSAMAFADFRRPQWGDMYSDMKTGSISTWLSAEWRALKDLRPKEFEWWTRVSKKYWDKYVEDYDYKFTRAPNGEGKGSKKRKAKAKENAAREKAIRLSNEAARRSSSRSLNSAASRRSTSLVARNPSLAPPMNILLPDQLNTQQYQPFGSPNILGLSGIPHHHLTPTSTLTPTTNGQLTYNNSTAGYFDGYTFPLTEYSTTPSPPQLLTPLEAPRSSHGYSHNQSPGPGQFQQNYFYPTQAQMNYAHHHATQAAQQQQQQQHQQLQMNICNNAAYYQPPSTGLTTHEYYSHPQQTPTHGIAHHIPTLAPQAIPSPQ